MKRSLKGFNNLKKKMFASGLAFTMAMSLSFGGVLGGMSSVQAADSDISLEEETSQFWSKEQDSDVWEKNDAQEQDHVQAVKTMKLGAKGLKMIKAFEQCRLGSYKVLSSEKYYTIGWGHYGPDVYNGMKITLAQADKFLESDAARAEASVNNFLKRHNIKLNQNQFDALVCFTYNVATKWMNGSTIRTYLINGIQKYSDKQITNAFCLHNKSGGKTLEGLTKRRKQEAALFLGKSTSLPPLVSEYAIPNNLKQGSKFNIAGVLSSDSAIKKVSVELYKSGKRVAGKTVQPNTKTYSLANFNDYIAFDKLSIGTYQYIITVTNSIVTARVIDEKFKVIDAHTHTYVQSVKKATPTADGAITQKCSKCGKVKSTEKIYAPKVMNLSTTTYTYKGNVKKPSVTISDSKGKKVDASHYSVSYQEGRVNVGTYKVTVTFNSEKYSGSIAKTFTINPAKVTLSSVKNSAGKKMTVKWTQNPSATGYQIKYSTKSNFSGSKKVTVTGASTLKKTLSGMAKGKRYYVKVRCYQTVNGVKYYSYYSNAISVVIKK